MTDEEIVTGYVNHVDRVPVFAPPTSRAELESARAETTRAANATDISGAWEAITQLIDREPERAWHLLLQALARCAPQHEHIIGAGPLEELLVKEPRRFADRVVSELKANERFQTAFAVIYFSTEYTTIEDANYFNYTLRNAGIPAELVPAWRIAKPDEAV